MIGRRIYESYDPAPPAAIASCPLATTASSLPENSRN